MHTHRGCQRCVQEVGPQLWDKSALSVSYEVHRPTSVGRHLYSLTSAALLVAVVRADAFHSQFSCSALKIVYQN